MSKAPYVPAEIETAWRARWDRMGLFRCTERADLPKFYCLVMFPYPSGALHVGHGRNYIIGDVMARFKMMQGYNVLHPMGWDAFGLPAENAALKSGTHPRDWVRRNIATMKEQINSLGIGYDWDREINTSEPDYYRWTQWVFLKLYEQGLAYRRDAPVNWCPSCQTALANEEVVNGLCERCDTPVEQKDLPQWFFRITRYAERLLEDLELLGHWPERVRRMQANWIGRSEGAEVNFTVAGTGQPLPCFTTRPDTLWGVTFMVLAPEHPILDELVAGTEREAQVRAFAERAREQGALRRVAGGVEKEGVFTGRYVVNPVNGEKVPLWVANYALMEYGTGAVMAVPAHDQRDFEFARQYGLPVRRVIEAEDNAGPGEEMTEAYEGPGVMVNSGPFDGTKVPEQMGDVIRYLEEHGMGRARVNYRLRDWLISRQRYWGAPIPIVHCPRCGIVPVPEDELPVLLPEKVDFTPRGRSPLALVEEFVRCKCPRCGGEAERETDTIAQWLCSCWYFLRYVSPRLKERPFDRRLADRWLPVDIYIGGVEHAVLHLLYSRFVTKVLYDAGEISFTEPFTRLFTQGMICKQSYVCTRCGKTVSDSPTVREPCACDLGVDVRTRIERRIELSASLDKMSKSKGNVVTFDEVIERYGADTLRLYTLAIGPAEKDAEWQDSGIVGYHRFLNRLWDLVMSRREALARAERTVTQEELDGPWRRFYQRTHATIRKVTQDVDERWHFNTAIASIISLFNEMQKLPEPETSGGEPTERGRAQAAALRFATERVLQLLAPLVPHICEELWSAIGNSPSIFHHGWPQYDEEAARAEQVEVPVQVNGKVRDRLLVERDEDEETLRRMALELENVRRHTEGRELKQVLVIPNRIVNIVVQ